MGYGYARKLSAEAFWFKVGWPPVVWDERSSHTCVIDVEVACVHFRGGALVSYCVISGCVGRPHLWPFRWHDILSQTILEARQLVETIAKLVVGRCQIIAAKFRLLNCIVVWADVCERIWPNAPS